MLIDTIIDQIYEEGGKKRDEIRIACAVRHHHRTDVARAGAWLDLLTPDERRALWRGESRELAAIAPPNTTGILNDILAAFEESP